MLHEPTGLHAMGIQASADLWKIPGPTFAAATTGRTDYAAERHPTTEVRGEFDFLAKLGRKEVLDQLIQIVRDGETATGIDLKPLGAPDASFGIHDCDFGLR
jgi:hypothetical protein